MQLHPNPILAKRQCTITIEQRFWSKVVKSDGCWTWTAAKKGCGYGVIGRGKHGCGNLEAHVVSWLLHKGEIQNGLFVCHACDVPECTNPDHLWLGTQKDNMHDASVKGRLPRGENRPNHLLTEKQVIQIRIDRTNGMTMKSIGSKHGVGVHAIFRIIHGQTWNHI